MSTIDISIAPGSVYVMTNISMPGLVKIGRTSRDAEIRACELWQTGVPTPFDVYASISTFNCIQLEAYAHGSLQKHRVNRSREFFRIDPDDAVKAIKEWLSIQADLWLGETCSLITAVPYKACVSQIEVERLAKELGQPIRLVSDALENITPDELKPALERAMAKNKSEEREILGRLGLLDDGDQQ